MYKFLGLAAALALGNAGSVWAQQVPSLHAVKIVVQDFERSTRFYSLLGLAPGAKYNAAEWQLRWEGQGRGSEIIMVRDETGRFNMVKGGGFLMFSVADVPATVARIKAAGFSVTGQAHTTPQATIQILKDPDGNAIELVGGPFGSPPPPRRP